jgi:lipopolysaccharide biosynthesis protein
MQNVCLFAHFDEHDTVDEYVFRYLEKIKKLNFSIILISAAKLDASVLERLRADCDDVIVRENAGHDFGSWSAGFAKHGASIGGRLLLANDSVYGPIGSLAGVLERLTERPADFYGLVENIEIAPHLQSWFLLFEPQVVRSATFAAILSQSFSQMAGRASIIEAGEVELSRRLVAAGFCYRALYMMSQEGFVTRRYGMSPMHLLWREMIVDEGVPFLKIELLRDNPLGIEDCESILRAIEPRDPQACSLARSHLARSSARPRSSASTTHWITDYRHSAVRREYRLTRQKRRAGAIWNAIKMEALTEMFYAWQVLRGHGPDRAHLLRR